MFCNRGKRLNDRPHKFDGKITTTPKLIYQQIERIFVLSYPPELLQLIIKLQNRSEINLMCQCKIKRFSLLSTWPTTIFKLI